ncbi:MAG: hypothetical protein KDB22_23885 [Planctomycetales bacterium]|nr:hypothetical protein [Planctomycetales bacterium]
MLGCSDNHMAQDLVGKRFGGNIVLLANLLLTASQLMGQTTDPFEGGAPRWQLVETDSNAQLPLHEISLIMPHAGRTCELLEVACSQGSIALLAYPIEPCLPLDEFQPQLWTRGASGGARLGVRVVFPLANHPVTQSRLTAILWGDSYSEPGRWQALRIESLGRKLTEEIASLRVRFGPNLPLDGAYVDSLVLNAYTGPGLVRMQLDDLSLNGLLPLSATGTPLPDDWRERWRWRYQPPSDEQKFWSNTNRPAVWIQHRDESLPWLQSLGIEGVVLGQLPSPAQLSKIHDAHLGVISPPPQLPVTFEQNDASSIKGWLVGAALDARQVDSAREQVQRTTTLDETLKRPIFGEALERHWQYSRIVDQVMVPAPDSSSAGSLNEQQRKLAESLETVKQRGQGWVSVNVDVNPAIEDQYRAALSALNGGDSENLVANPLGLRRTGIAAVRAGARGLFYRTTKPLNEQTSAGRAQVAALRWLNNNLELWGPWLARGQVSTRPEMDRADFAAACWYVSESTLVVVQAATEGSQYCVPGVSDRPLTIKFQSPSPLQVFRLTEGALESMPLQRSPAGLVWTVDHPRADEAFIVTANPLVIQFARKVLKKHEQSNASDILEIAEFQLAIASQLMDARYASGGDDREAELTRLQAAAPHLRTLADAQRQLEQGQRSMRVGQSVAAIGLGLSAMDAIQSVLFESHLTAVANLSAPQSSPFVVAPPLLHMHWQLAAACSRSSWRQVPLPGAQFTDLNQVVREGWSQQRRLEDQVDLLVELVPSPQEKTGGLRLAAYPLPGQAVAPQGGYEGASLRIRSAAATIPHGQLVRVSAKASVLKDTPGNGCGLLVYDNQAGPSLGQLVQGRAGDQIAIELYRFMASGEEFRLLAECRGQCDILLEDIQVNAIRPAQTNSNFLTSPAVSFESSPVDGILELPQ